ncbi:MAG: hypothetical protein LQ343_001821 [Gyalolechia ehrenbergii]|nr:MAG: hypothetical protein LQ343_001821 [Gyalolechia ehrenbergii]
MIWFFPGSPRWLCKVVREDESRYILERLKEEDSIESSGKAEADFHDVRKVIKLERKSAKSQNYLYMFFGYQSRKIHIGRRVQLVILLQIMQEWIGIAGITICSRTIFGIAGLDHDTVGWVAGLNQITYTLSTLVCVFTSDRIGHRSTLYWGSVVQSICLFLTGGLSRVSIHAKDANIVAGATDFGGGAASMVFLFTITFGATWLTVPWLYPAGIFPLEVRARGNAWGVVSWSIGNGWLTLLFPVMFSALNEKTLYIFSACNVLTIPMVYCLYPEPNQRTLEEMHLLFAADAIWVWDAERNYKLLIEQNPELVQTAQRGRGIDNAEGGVGKSVGHVNLDGDAAKTKVLKDLGVYEKEL